MKYLIWPYKVVQNIVICSLIKIQELKFDELPIKIPRKNRDPKMLVD